MSDQQFVLAYWIAVAVVIGAVWLPALLATLLRAVRARAASRTAAARDIAAAADIPADTDRDAAPIDARDFQPGTDWNALVACRAIWDRGTAQRRNTRTEDPR